MIMETHPEEHTVPSNKSVPISSKIQSIPIPSQEILPKDNDYKNYREKKELQYTESGSLILNSQNLKLLCIK